MNDDAKDVQLGVSPRIDGRRLLVRTFDPHPATVAPQAFYSIYSWLSCIPIEGLCRCGCPAADQDVVRMVNPAIFSSMAGTSSFTRARRASEFCEESPFVVARHSCANR